MNRRLNLDRIYLDQSMSRTDYGERIVTAAYTPHGIHRIDSLYMRRIRSGYGSKIKLRREIMANSHLHKTIKGNLIGNLDNLFDQYKRDPRMTYIPPGSFVMIRDCEYDRDIRPYKGDMLSHHAGGLGIVEWYQDSGDLSVCLHDGCHGDDERTYLGHKRATFRHEELEVLWESPYHQS